MRRMSLTLWLVLLLLGGAGSAVHADWEAGVAAFKANNFTEAIKQFQQVVEQQPEFAGGHQMLGQSLLKSKQSAQAVPHLQRALELKPGDDQTELALGQALLQSGKYRDCVALLEKANLGAMPANLQNVGYQIKGACTDKGGGDATADLKKVAEMKPNDAAAQYAYGASALQAGQTDPAVAALAKAVELDGNNTTYLDTYVNALKRQARLARGDGKVAIYKKAIPPAQKLASLQANYENVLQLGEVQMGAKMYDQAAANFKKSSGLKASDFLPHYYLGQTYTAAEQYSQAEPALKKALELARTPDDQKSVWRQLGFVYEKAKKFDQSIEAYQKAGDTSAVARVQENKRIDSENKDADAHNQEVQKLKEQQERLRKEMESLPGSEPPR